MSLKSEIVEKEKKSIKDFFNKDINVPDIPHWVTEELLLHWQENIFYAHYLPSISLEENLDLPKWKEKPIKLFYKKIEEGKLKESAKKLPGKWILIDTRDKPQKKSIWITVEEANILKKIGIRPRNYLKKLKKQPHQKEYLKKPLNEKGFGSRFCLTIEDARSFYPFILDFLKIERGKNIRLPFLIEYNYLGNAFYNQWKEEETWEWLEDTLMDGNHLAVGSKRIGRFGWDPPNFWSTMLTFRPVIEL